METQDPTERKGGREEDTKVLRTPPPSEFLTWSRAFKMVNKMTRVQRKEREGTGEDETQ